MDYITPKDKLKLQEELNACIRNRKVLSERIGTARELGDLKENAEYHAAREDQGHNERRIRDLEERLSSAIVTDADNVPKDMVFIGARVKLRNLATEEEELYSLVGQSNNNFDSDYIEVTPTSPMGEALMKSRIGETVRVDLPRGEKRFEIVEIVTD